MPGLLANGLRFLAAAILLVGIIGVTQGFAVLRVSRDELAFAALMGVMLLGVGIGTLSLAMRYVPSGVAALIVAVIPLWIVILRLFAHDRPSPLTLIGVVIGMSGLALLILPGGTDPGPDGGTTTDVVVWSIAILVSAFSWAFFSWKSTSFPLPRNAAVMTVYELLAAGAALVGLGAVLGQRIDVGTYSTASWIGWSYLIAASIAGFTAYTWLIARAPMSLVSTYAYVNPVVAVFLGWLILSERLTPDVLWAMVIITVGVALVVNGERVRRPKTQTLLQR